MTDPFPTLDDSIGPESSSPLPEAVERVSAYAWRRGALETIVFHGAATLTTAAGPLPLDEGTWLLARWDGPPLPDVPAGELVCVLREMAQDAPHEAGQDAPQDAPQDAGQDAAQDVTQDARPEKLPPTSPDRSEPGCR